jgi:hypothetical protein
MYFELYPAKSTLMKKNCKALKIELANAKINAPVVYIIQKK